MFMYLSHRDFNINKGKIQVENKDNLIVLCILNTTCDACNYAKNILHEFPDFFPEINFAIVNIDKHPQLINMFKNTNIVISKTPTYMLFKFGVFSRFLNIDCISKESLRKALFFELEIDTIVPKNQNCSKYLTLSEI